MWANGTPTSWVRSARASAWSSVVGPCASVETAAASRTASAAPPTTPLADVAADALATAEPTLPTRRGCLRLGRAPFLP